MTPGDGSSASSLNVRAHGENMEMASPAVTTLKSRLLAMAKRWRYTDKERAEVLELAGGDPAKWLRAVELDELREAEFRRRGLLA